MSGAMLTATEMYAVLNSRVREAGGVAKLATKTGLNLRTLANAVNGHKGLGTSVPLALGYRPVTVTMYQPFFMPPAPTDDQSPDGQS